MIITVFLVVLIVSLLLGNFLLSLLKPKPAPADYSISPAKPVHLGSVINSNPGQSSLPNKQNILSITNRIDRVEKLLLRANAPKFIGKNLDSTVLGKKMNDFTQFKTSTKVEIEALKEEVARLKTELGVKEKKRPGEDFEISDDKLHNLVFRTGANKG